MRVLTRSVGVLVATVVAAAAGLVLGVRSQYQPVIRLVRRVLRDHGNPRQLRRAGGPGVRDAVVEHLGRSSGRQYRTPVTPVPTPDGFIVALPYGPDSDWVRNVLAAGSATLVHDGERVPVDRPEVQPIASHLPDLSIASRAAVQLFGVRTCLVLHRAR